MWNIFVIHLYSFVYKIQYINRYDKISIQKMKMLSGLEEINFPGLNFFSTSALVLDTLSLDVNHRLLTSVVTITIVHIENYKNYNGLCMINFKCIHP